jgi:5-methylthioadenosine/S-adenosylhomocysteine deaminase
MCAIGRRGFLTGLAGTTFALAEPLRLEAQVAQPQAAPSGGKRSLPRGEFVISNAYIITMDPQLGEIPSGSIYVRDGTIVDIGPKIEAPPNVETIDASRQIVLPGLIDTHWHMWHTIFRSFAGDSKDSGFFPTVTRFAKSMSADDMYQSSRLAAAEAVSAGITTVHDWCHNIRSREHAEGDIRALRDIGIRARWSFGQAIDQPLSQPIRLDDLRLFSADWRSYSNEGLIGLGMAWRGMFRHGAVPLEVARLEFDTARKLGLPISVHIGTIAKDTVGDVVAHADGGFLGPDVNIVHATAATQRDVDLIKAAGSNVSILAYSEMLGGWGPPSLKQFVAAGVPTALGVDSSVLIGGANLFNILKLAIGLINVEDGSEFAINPRRALQLATVDAAAMMGIADKVGSLRRGMRADLIAVSTDGLNMGVFTDPARMLIECTTPANVETVVIDGRVLKRDGKLVGIDVPEIVNGARASLKSVREKAAWR